MMDPVNLCSPTTSEHYLAILLDPVTHIPSPVTSEEYTAMMQEAEEQQAQLRILLAAVQSLPSLCDRCMQTARNVSRCVGCLTRFYCSPECQKDDWKDHQVDCIYPKLDALALGQIYRDARQNKAQAQLVLGILYLYGVDFQKPSQALLNHLEHLKEKEDNPYASLALGIIYASLNKKNETVSALNHASNKGMVDASAFLCHAYLNERKSSKERAKLDSKILSLYAKRFIHPEQAAQSAFCAWQEFHCWPLLKRHLHQEKREVAVALLKLKNRFMPLMFKYLLKLNTSYPVPKGEKMNITPIKGLARNFLNSALAQGQSFAEKV